MVRLEELVAPLLPQVPRGLDGLQRFAREDQRALLRCTGGNECEPGDAHGGPPTHVLAGAGSPVQHCRSAGCQFLCFAKPV